MKNKDALSCLLIEDNLTECSDFCECAGNRTDFNIVATTDNSYDGIELFCELQPNVVILDLQLNAGSGFEFLEELKHLSGFSKPFILVTTDNSSSVVASHLKTSGVDFILYKYSTDYSPKRAIDLLVCLKNSILNINSSNDEEKLNPVRRSIMTELINVGINPKSKGFMYLCDAILIYGKEKEGLTKQIAKMYQKSEPSVERAMQRAIDKAWDTTDDDTLIAHYTAKIRADKGSPTLLEFVAYYAQKILQ